MAGVVWQLTAAQIPRAKGVKLMKAKSHTIFSLILTLALLLGSGAWLPAGRTTAAASPAPAGLAVAEWRAIQSQVAKLTGADGVTYDQFGNAVSVDGDTAVVGAPAANAPLIAQGAAYVLYRDQGGPDAWGQVAKLTAADGAPYDVFGNSVSVSGDTVVVGAEGADTDYPGERGAAYVFYRS
jgi:hypothetical protein